MDEKGARGGGVPGFPGRPAAPPARGRGARPALPRAPSSFPLLPSLDLKLQFALQLAECVEGVGEGGDRGTGEQGWILGTALGKGETAEGGAPPLQPPNPKVLLVLWELRGGDLMTRSGCGAEEGFGGGQGRRGWAACPVTW